MTLLLDTLALFFAFVLIAAAVHKLLDPRRVATAAAQLMNASPAAGAWLWKAAATVEIVAGVALIVRPIAYAGFLLAAGLWLVYAAALVRMARNGSAFDCGCTFGSRTHAPPTFVILRAISFAAVAAIAGLALFSAATPRFGIEAALGLQAALAAAALFSLHLAAGELAVSAQSAGSRP